MKVLFPLILFFPLLIFAQGPKMSVKTQADVAFIQRQAPLLKKGDKDLLRELPIMEINGDLYVSFIGQLANASLTPSSTENVIFGKGKGAIRSVRIRLNALSSIESLTELSYLELAGKINPHLNKVGFDTRADSVHRGLNLPQSYTGRNVLIGINDWGYDYTHPMFYDTTLTTHRIHAAWDQFKRSGPHPSDYSYGTEYTTSAALLAATGDTTNQLGTGTHGTHVAGIAAGSGAGVLKKGMAFDAKYLFTTILVDEAAALDSWYWMQEKAEEANKRLVVNMSWGLYHFGTNDGTSLLSQALDNLSDEGVLFVSSAGNNGNVNFHFERTFNNDSIRSQIEFYNYDYHDSLWGQSIHGWGEVGKSFEVKFQVYSSSNVLLYETPFYATSMNGYEEQFFVLNGADTIWYNLAAQSSHPQNSKPTVRLRIKNTHYQYRIELVAKADEGKVHFWNLVELTTNGGNWGQAFISRGSGYIGGNTSYGIGEPTCATKCISVASHVPSYLHSNGVNVLGGARSSFSSIGPRLDGMMKPEISGPGSAIMSSINSYSDEDSPSLTTTFNGRTYGFASFSGTSMSSPAVAGLCALVLEVNPYLSPDQVKEIVISTARLDNFTGQIPASGSTSWGFGKANAMAMVRAAINFVGLKEVESSETGWNVYPNPSSTVVRLQGLTAITDVQLIDVNGKQFQLSPQADSWNVEDFAKGTYIFRVVANDRVYQKKLTIL